MARLTRLLLVVLGICAPRAAAATPVVYGFGGTTTNLSFSAYLPDPATGLYHSAPNQELLSFWFPGLTLGGELPFTGTLAYDTADDLGANLMVDLIGHQFLGRVDLRISRGMTDQVSAMSTSPSIVTPMPSTQYKADDLAIQFWNDPVVPVALGTPLDLLQFTQRQVVFDGLFGSVVDTVNGSETVWAWMGWAGTVTHMEPVPEPSTWLLLVVGSGIVGVWRWWPA